MKKVILILLLLAAIAVAWYYFEPQDPAADKVATVKNVDVKEVIKQRNFWNDGAVDGDADTEDSVEEEVVQAILPGKTVADVQDAVLDELVVADGADVYTIADGSVVTWVGKKVWGQHNGEIAISDGSVQVAWGDIVTWKFTMDLNTIKTLDIDSEKLDDTLKEWFNAAEYPAAEFILVEVSGTNVVGILTINNISKQISFPATVIVEDDTIIAKADFALDRNEWNVAGGTPAVSEFMELWLDITWTK